MTWIRISGMAALMVALAVGLALSLGLWSSWTASAQDTFIVNDDTTPAAGAAGRPTSRRKTSRTPSTAAWWPTATR